MRVERETKTERAAEGPRGGEQKSNPLARIRPNGQKKKMGTGEDWVGGGRRGGGAGLYHATCVTQP